ncbi:hypothetical protein Fot_03444 [Forsythia ovata]|uniref:Uncharacterized protein n=1 Tax=Forsythia ovata TaxID=205694 RepID=A0ABD1X9Q3_9LAMI
MRHKKLSIAQIVSNFSEQVQMLVQKNRVRITLSSSRIIDEDIVGVEARAPAVSHSYPYNDPRDSMRYQPVDSLKYRERRPTSFASVFDRLGDKADSHQRKASSMMGEG